MLKSIEDRVMTAFPTSASRLPKASIRKNIPVYCICWHIKDGSKMIECDTCQQWFHVACMIDKSLHKDRRSKVYIKITRQCGTALHAVQYKLITICNSLITCILIFLLHDAIYWAVVSLMSAWLSISL